MCKQPDIKDARQGQHIAVTNPLAFDIACSFEDLVIDSALPQVHVIIVPGKEHKKHVTHDDLLTEVQCEV